MDTVDTIMKAPFSLLVIYRGKAYIIMLPCTPPCLDPRNATGGIMYIVRDHINMSSTLY